MPYLSKQQTLKQWAQLVTETEVNSLKQIQQTDFTSKLLIKLDPDHFKPALEEYTQAITFSQLFHEISRYYSRQIGTKIEQIIGEDANIYSSSSIQQIWELILGIAIKGRNRQKNINIILKMRPQTQEDLMRIISKLINNLGENVSSIDGPANRSVSQVSGGGNSNDTDLIIELSEQNEHLREKVEEMNGQIASLREKNKNLKAQIEQRNRERTQIIDLMIRQPVSSKISVSSVSGKNSDIIIEFIKDMINQVGYLSKQLTKKEQKQNYLQDVNRDLKIAYSAAVLDAENIKKAATETKVDVDEFERKIEELRSENLEYAEREKDFITKIGELEQQKFYLKQIVQRLQVKNKEEQSKEKAIISKKVPKQQNSQEEQQKKQKRAQTARLFTSSSFEKEPQSPDKNERYRTVRGQIDEIKQPSEKNKLQRQISHLQKKLNAVQEQNGSLKKINAILEKVINDFTKESAEMMQKYESQFQPMFQQFQQIIAEQEKNRKQLQEEFQAKQNENLAKIKEIAGKMKEKITEYDERCLEYQKIIKKLEIERDQLLKSLQIYKQRPPVIQIQQRQKPKPTLSAQKVQVSIPATQQKQVASEKQPQIKIIAKNQEQNQKKSQYPEEKSQNTEQTVEQNKKQQQNFLCPQIAIHPESKPQDQVASIIMQQQEQDRRRRRQYSFMGNRQSTYQFGGEDYLGINQNSKNIIRGSSFGSEIQEECGNSIIEQQRGNVQNEGKGFDSLGHVQIMDITQIEEELAKIKQHYVQMNHQSQSMCQFLKKSKTDGKAQKQSKMEEIVKNLQSLTEPNKQNIEKLESYLKKLESEGIDKAQITTQNIKIKQQNAALRQQIYAIRKERKAIEERLNNLHKQSAKNLDEKTKQQLNKLGASLNEIKSIMLQSENSYLQLQDYMQSIMINQQQKISILTSQVKQLKQELKQKDYAVAQLEMESNFLLSAVLELRNSSVRSY